MEGWFDEFDNNPGEGEESQEAGLREKREIKIVRLGDQPFQRRKSDARDGFAVGGFKVIQANAENRIFFEN